MRVAPEQDPKSLVMNIPAAAPLFPVFAVPGATAPAQAPLAVSASDASYVLVPQTASLADAETEGDKLVTQVEIVWGQNVLHTQHVESTRGFALGETNADCVIPAERLGAERLQVLRGVGGSHHARIANTDRAALLRTDSNGQRHTIGGATLASMCSDGELALSLGDELTLDLGDGLAVRMSTVRAGKRSKGSVFSLLRSAAHKYVGASFVFHASLVAMGAFYMPSMTSGEDATIDRDQILFMQKMLNAQAERDQEQQPSTSEAPGGSDATGAPAAKGPEGKLGPKDAPAITSRAAYVGPKDNMDPKLQRKLEIEEAAKFGMTSLLIGSLASPVFAPNEPASPWGSPDALGRDDHATMGNAMWGQDLGAAAGNGGLGLSGFGEAGGGPGDGISAGGVHTYGRGPGNCVGANCTSGWGNSHGTVGGEHKPKFSFRQGPETQVNGRLPPEVVQRIVHANFGRFRACYEAGLRENPALSGRVVAKFMIGRGGEVTAALDGGSDLPNATVVQCVVRNFLNLSFPAPEGGTVSVVYPFNLSPQ